MATPRKHAHRRSSSLHVEQESQASVEKVVLASQIEAAETIKLLEESQNKAHFQTIIEDINLDHHHNRNPRKPNKKIAHGLQHLPSLLEHSSLSVSQAFSNQMLEISQVTTIGPVVEKQADYVPLRNRMKYLRSTEMKFNKPQTHNHNSYEDLLNFNLSQFGCLVEEIPA